MVSLTLRGWDDDFAPESAAWSRGDPMAKAISVLQHATRLGEHAPKAGKLLQRSVKRFGPLLTEMTLQSTDEVIA